MVRAISIDGEMTKKNAGKFSLKNQQRNFLTVSVAAFLPKRGKFMWNISILPYVGTIEWE
ncbi:hypothetical protein [Sphingobium boeckii]|uniref:Uncharacterized protein n=1 Tax=Sphingobium boeckii TaxID=1082345 RepID=A0A7W9ALB1_9SPHN|nr:hypothetical protein [Sphingobium boeckii]MBB5687773.1 hypothetical protein [Sphingobium boeckii]